MNLTPNTIFAGRYRLIEHIGSGGFSVVWKAADQMAEEAIVAIKIYSPDKGMDEFGLKQFRREYAVVLNINHPGLLTARHFDIHEGHPYLVMPYCPGGSLHRKLMELGAMPEKDIAAFVHRIADALEHLHDNEVLHQDIKPDNVLIDQKGNYLLTDFGISSRLRSTLRKSTGTSKAMTVAYAPPERFSGSAQALPASDIFSVGVLIFELATGDVPWMGAGGAILHPESLPLELPEEYSKGLEQWMQACLAYQPEQRPTATQLKQAADKYLQTGQWPTLVGSAQAKSSSNRKTEQQPHSGRKTEQISQAPPQPAPTTPLGKKQDNTVPILLALLALILLAGGGFWLWSSGQENARIACEETFKQAEEQLKAKDFREALINYRKAKDCCTDNCPLAQAGEKATLDSLQGRYDALIAQGDALLVQGKFEEARARYSEAGQWHSEGKKPEDKLAEVEQKEQDKQAELARQEEEAERKKKEEQERQARLPTPIQKLLDDMVTIPGGPFMMGCSPGDDECFSNESPRHEVYISTFQMGKYEVTQAQWRAVMGASAPLSNPSHNTGCDQCPVESVSWNDIVNDFLPKLNRITGKNFRLPTEAEWEYAARGGTTTRFHTGNCLSTQQANYDGNYPASGCSKGDYRKKTLPVGSFSPNGYDLHDMHGNVWEWCSDWYGKDYYENSPRNNPKGPSAGSYRVLRGGSWGNFAEYCRASFRGSYYPVKRHGFNGFRLSLQ